MAWWSQCTIPIGAGLLRVRNAVWARSTAPILTGPEANTFFCTRGNRALSWGVKWLRRRVNKSLKLSFEFKGNVELNFIARIMAYWKPNQIFQSRLFILCSKGVIWRDVFSNMDPAISCSGWVDKQASVWMMDGYMHSLNDGCVSVYGDR